MTAGVTQRRARSGVPLMLAVLAVLGLGTAGVPARAAEPPPAKSAASGPTAPVTADAASGPALPAAPEAASGTTEAAAADAPAPLRYPPVYQEELYMEGVRALEAGHAEEASRLFLRFLEGEPQHAGAWLDLAISQCALGHGAEAERLFSEIQRRFETPPSIVEIIAAQRASGCRKPALRSQVMLSFSRGYDTNVNQGANSPSFQTGSGTDNELHWELGPEYLPKADRYSQAVADYSQPLNQGGLFGFAQLRARRNDSVRSQDIVSLLAGIEQPWQWGRWRARGTFALSALQLNGQYYQRQTQVQMRVTPPIALPDRLEVSLSAGVNHVAYPTRTKYDSNTFEVGSMLRYYAGATLGQASVGVLADQGQSGRLGGDRLGWYATVLADTRWNDRFSTQLLASRQVWRSDEVYSPAVIDIKRHQDTQQISASATWHLMPHHSVQLEARAVRNRENIGLFQYNSRMLQLSYRWDNF